MIRAIDDLGRIVIPKEIRRDLRIHEGDQLNVEETSDGCIIIRKCSPLNEAVKIAGQLCRAIHREVGSIVAVTDGYGIVASAGARDGKLDQASLSKDLVEKIWERHAYWYDKHEDNMIMVTDSTSKYYVSSIKPIVSNNGELLGSVIFVHIVGSGEPINYDTEEKLTNTAAEFLRAYHDSI